MTIHDIPLGRRQAVRGALVLWLGLIGAEVACVLLGAVSSASARPVKIWSFEELNEEADLVVIGTASATADARNHSYPDAKDDTWVVVDTQFRVRSVLKGKLPTETLSVRHNRFYSKRGELIVDGPAFVEFKPELKHQYLIFLKRTEDELWEPVTGQHDPFTSFFMLQRYHVTKERKTSADNGE